MTRRVLQFSLVSLISTLLAACAGSNSSPTAPSVGRESDPLASAVAAKPDAAAPQHILNPVGFGMVQGLVVFPPRNEPNVFFQNLQALYRDTLRRPQTETFVDSEGQNVWLTEYFRFYLNGCSHEEATSRTLSEIANGTTIATCGAENLTFPPRNLPNEFQNRLQAAYRDVLRRPATLSYVDSEGANVWLAQYLRFRTVGTCSHAEAESRVFTEIRGGGVQPNCAAPTILTETLTGALSGGTTTTCSDGTFIKPCAQFDFVLQNSGTLAANLQWTPGSGADLDLSIWRGTTLIARSASATRDETVSSAVTGGGTRYSLRVTYYSGSQVANFTLRVTRPN